MLEALVLSLKRNCCLWPSRNPLLLVGLHSAVGAAVVLLRLGDLNILEVINKLLTTTK